MDSLRAVASVLFERHHLAVYRYFLRMTGQRELAEDLTQDLFLRVVRGLAGYQDTDRERPWLFRIARNLLIDYQRQAGRQVMVPLSEAEALTVTASAALSVDLAQALAQLTNADREVFLLRETGGLSYEEIAQVCGSTVSAIRSRLYRTRALLREAISNKATSVGPRRIDFGRTHP